METNYHQNQNNMVLSCNVIASLQDYMLNEKNMNVSLKESFSLSEMKHAYKKVGLGLQENGKNVKNGINLGKSANNNGKGNFFIPNQKDSLFWCFYIMKNGDVKYELLGKITLIIEKNLKIEYVEKIRKEKQLIKPYKFSSLTKIETQLANESKIDLKTLLSLCVIENINVFYIHKRTYYELLMNDSDEIFVISSFDNDAFGYKIMMKTDIELQKYKDTLFKIENIEKPIKSMTSYTVKELADYCGKLAIETTNKETGKTKSKKDLYEAFLQYF